MDITKSIGLFVLAGLCEIGGGYLVWIWLREGRSVWIGITGALILILYGIVATFQTANFGRVYAAYGGIFIILAIFWGWVIDKKTPDKFELIGGFIALVGMLIIMYWPRR
jgi:small multidrug resistance family-3 protein